MAHRNQNVTRIELFLKSVEIFIGNVCKKILGYAKT